MTTRKLTSIYKFTSLGESQIGQIENGKIYEVYGTKHVECGRVSDDLQIFRTRQHDEQELGVVNSDGVVTSHGLFEGGTLGWLEDDGVVIQGGLILGEEEVGRVEGPDAKAAAGALLLYFLPKDAEMNREMGRRA